MQNKWSLQKNHIVIEYDKMATNIHSFLESLAKCSFPFPVLLTVQQPTRYNIECDVAEGCTSSMQHKSSTGTRTKLSVSTVSKAGSQTAIAIGSSRHAGVAPAYLPASNTFISIHADYIKTWSGVWSGEWHETSVILQVVGC